MNHLILKSFSIFRGSRKKIIHLKEINSQEQQSNEESEIPDIEGNLETSSIEIERVIEFINIMNHYP